MNNASIRERFGTEEHNTFQASNIILELRTVVDAVVT